MPRIERTEGMAVVYATGPNKKALDGVSRNSPFAEALIRRVKEPGVEAVKLLLANRRQTLSRDVPFQVVLRKSL